MSDTKQIPCEVYSRIVGYYRPVQNWHKGKQQEFADRKMFTLDAPEMKAALELPDKEETVEWVTV